MKFHTAAIFLVATVLLAPSALGQRRIDMTFNGQMAGLVADLKEKIEADSQLTGRKLRAGKFSGPTLPDSSFELAFEKKFSTLMGSMLETQGTFTASGTYSFLPGEDPGNKDLQVIQIVITVTDRRGRTMQTVTREVNNSADIARICGASVALPDDGSIEERNAAVDRAFYEPTFQAHNQHKECIVSPNGAKYGVEIRRQRYGTGPAASVALQDVNGFPFVDLAVDDTFSIMLFNFDSQHDASAVVTIDGLDVANTFCTDDVRYEGFVVPRATKSRPGKHDVKGWLETTKRPTDNVYQFVINELGKGAATEMKSRNRIGVIHVDFFEAVPPEEQLPSRNFGEVGKGKPMDVAYKVKPMQLRDSPAASIAIRYSNPR